MLEWLEVKNFQKFRKKRIEFDPHVTVLTGQTNAGKSTLIRALRWLCLNLPTGDAFTHFDGAKKLKDCKVTLGVDGKVITRERGKDNKYQLDSSVYQAFGSSVPQDIETLLNLDEHNFQMQLDSPFFFLLSPGEVAKELNRVVNLELIDTTLSSLATILRRYQEAERISQERLERARDKSDCLSWAVQADKEFTRIEILEEELDKTEEEISYLSLLIEEAEELDRKRDTAGDRLWELAQIVEVGKSYRKSASEASSLTNLLTEVETCQERLARKKDEVTELEQQMEERLAGKCPLCGTEIGTERTRIL